MVFRVPDNAAVLQGKDIPAILDPASAVVKARGKPVGREPLSELVWTKRPDAATITISGIVPPVPKRVFLSPMLKVLNAPCPIRAS